ncbi:autoinducer binding domain-containing protein [Mesorhizobium sp.]|uniref:autoinducer binding domain-containing protein n=1 Tax=Mesorhizobium sp. TaxID=1871066 RepID=UPI00257E1C04|nr:autoinducer binding domain-containing protein [Mesorhizobium sp.]
MTGSTTEDERRVCDEAATFGLRSGISVPLHGPGGRFAIMSFAQASDRQFQNRRITYLQFAAFHFHLRVAKFASLSNIEEAPDLSLSEKECILWIDEIVVVMGQLGISMIHGQFPYKNLVRKLDTAGRTVSAIKATNFGIIRVVRSG